MMVVRVVTRTIACSPVCSFQRRRKHMQFGVTCGDGRSFCHRVGRHHMVEQSFRYVRPAVERYGNKNDGGPATGDCEVSFRSGNRTAAHGQQHGFKLLLCKGGNRLGGSSIRVEHLDPAQIKWSCPEVSQMQLIHKIIAPFAWECRGLEGHPYFEL